jgi:hypothetical protein
VDDAVLGHDVGKHHLVAAPHPGPIDTDVSFCSARIGMTLGPRPLSGASTYTLTRLCLSLVGDDVADISARLGLGGGDRGGGGLGGGGVVGSPVVVSVGARAQEKEAEGSARNDHDELLI